MEPVSLIVPVIDEAKLKARRLLMQLKTKIVRY